MKFFCTLFFFFLIINAVYPQSEFIDYNQDNTSVSEYKEIITGGTKSSALSPYHTTPQWTATRQRQIGGMAFGDYDNDGDLDLAVGCYYSNSYPPINDYENLIYKNTNGLLDTIPAWVSGDERTTTDIKWADINGDGRPDLISGNGNFQKSVIYFNSASGLSTSPGWISVDNVWTVGVSVSDVDGNGWLDVTFGNQGVSPDPNRPIQIFFNNNGTLSSAPGWSSADLMITNSVAYSDLNNDYLTTVTNLTYTADGNTSVFNLPNIPVYAVDSVKVAGVKTTQFCSDDLNGWVSLGFKPSAGSEITIAYKYISRGDLAAVKWSGFESGIYFNNAGVLNTFPGWTNGITNTEKGAAWADFDRDGYMDLAIGGNGGPTSVYKNNNGVMSTLPVWTSASTNTSAQEVVAADVNKDGFTDLAVIHFGNSRAEIFFNIGGVLETVPSWTYTTGSSATSISFGDVNGDGWLDLAVGTARAPIVIFIADPSLVPVEFNSFTSEFSGNKILLRWITASEKNNSGFEVERKLKGTDSWEKRGFVEGNGTTAILNSYEYSDIPSSPGTYQYRLKQIDYDGSYSFSSVSEVEFYSTMSFELGQNYPNPFNPATKINYSVPEDGFFEIKLFDILGKEIRTILSGNVKAGNYELIIHGQDLDSGVYIYRMTGSGFSQSRKMILLK